MPLIENSSCLNTQYDLYFMQLYSIETNHPSRDAFPSLQTTLEQIPMAMEDHLDVSKLDHQRYGLAALKNVPSLWCFFLGGCFSSIYLEKYVCIYCIYTIM